MTINTELNKSLEEFQEVCRARRNAYYDILPYAKDKICKRIIINNINQSSTFLHELNDALPAIDNSPEKETFITLVYRSMVVFRPLEVYKAKRELYIVAEEIERATIEFYSNILTDSVPVPLDIIITRQLEDIRIDYEKVLFLKQALSEIRE